MMSPDAAPAITPLRETWRQLQKTAGQRAPQLRRSVVGLAAAAAVQGLALACILPLFLALLTRADAAASLTWLLIMTVLMMVSTVLRWRAQAFDFDGDMVATTHDLRTALGQQLRRIPLDRLQDQRSGEVNATLLGNVDENLSYTLTVANLIATALITPIVTALAILPIDWRLGLALALVFPLLIPIYRWRRPAYGHTMREVDEAHRRTNADIVEYCQGLTVLRAARCAGERADRLDRSLAHLEQLQAAAQRRGALPELTQSSVMELAILIVVAVGALLVSNGRSEVAALAALLVIVVRFAEPLATFVIYTKVIDLIEAALRNIDRLLATPALPLQTPEAIPQSFEVRFDEVQYQYRGATAPALQGLNLTLPAASLTALVGPSGAGKTTVTRLLQRHADPQQGHVSIGGIDVRKIAPEVLDRLVSVVFQDVYLFDDTVLANIRMARPEASDDEVRAAARAANCHDFIDRFPDGYLTRVGEIGGRLSGGERQRISIARAILKNAPIVVLDEPTAALDSESERAVQAAIDSLVRDRTVLVIAHRLSTIIGADQILVLADGRLAEQGSHEALLATSGRYARMWAAHLGVKDWHARA